MVNNLGKTFFPSMPRILGWPKNGDVLEGLTEYEREIASPSISIVLPSFSICSIPITRQIYAEICLEMVLQGRSESLLLPNGWQKLSEGLNAETANLPVTTVTWRQADDFCKLIGGRLPSEFELEAAHGQWVSEVNAFGNPWPKLLELHRIYNDLELRYPDFIRREVLIGESDHLVWSGYKTPIRFYLGAMGEWCNDIFRESLYKEEEVKLDEEIIAILDGDDTPKRTRRGGISLAGPHAIMGRRGVPETKGSFGFRCVWQCTEC
jgi:formylglycine-generating enzyme required for sulfatase activity